MQEGGRGVSPAQKAQRARFKTAQQNFRGVSAEDRHRWYEAEPIWSSFLWYYNYFIMSSLTGNATPNQGGAGVIKSIQFVSKSIPTAGNESITINTVDPAKTVVMLFGNSFISDKVQRGSGTVAQGETNTHTLDDEINVDIAEAVVHGLTIFIEMQEGGQGEGHGAYPYISGLTSTSIKISSPNLGQGNITYDWEVIEHKAQTIYPYIKAITATSITISWPITPSVAAVIGAIVIEYI
jgi:hypothetical protein